FPTGKYRCGPDGSRDVAATLVSRGCSLKALTPAPVCSKKKACRSPLHQAAAYPLHNRGNSRGFLSSEGANPQNVQNAKLRPLRNIPKLFLGPPITPKLKSLVQPKFRANRNSRPAPNWPSTLVSLPK